MKLFFFLLTSTLGFTSCKSSVDSRSEAIHKFSLKKALSNVTVPLLYEANFTKDYKGNAKNIQYNWEEKATSTLGGFKLHPLTLTVQKRKVKDQKTFNSYTPEDQISILDMYTLARILFPQKCILEDRALTGLVPPLNEGERLDEKKAKNLYTPAYASKLLSSPSGNAKRILKIKTARICVYKVLQELLLGQEASSIAWP